MQRVMIGIPEGALVILAFAGCTSKLEGGGTTGGTHGVASESGPSSDGSPPADDTAGVCEIGEGDAFEWSWSLDGLELYADGYTEDAAPLLECDVVAGDPEADPLVLKLSCAIDGEDIGPQTLTISPPPETLPLRIAAGEPLHVAYRPGNACPNGCFLDGGWLAVRTEADGELQVAFVDAQRELSPVADLLGPVGIAVAPSACLPLVGDDCDTPPQRMRQALDVTVAIGGEELVLVAGDAAEIAGFEVVVDRAETGIVDGCTFDGGDPSRIDLMIAKLP